HWSAMSSPMTNGWTIDAKIDALAATPASADTVYATAGGHIFVTFDHGANWQQHDILGFTDHFAGLLVDPTDDQIAYAVRDRFTGGSQTGGHVFRTDDGGVNWLDISADLPN